MDQAGGVAFGTAGGRWVVAAAVLGSSVAFLDATVVNVALPAIGRDLDAGLSGLQWVLDGYLLTLSALLLLGGSLGDLYGRRRIFSIGLVWFSLASVLCGLAPSTGALVAARALQGVGGALLVPGSLSILTASFRSTDRGAAVGAWSGLTGMFTAVGPFAGGWLVDTASWRLIFLVNLPVAATALWATTRHVPESSDPQGGRRPDLAGSVLATVGLGGLVYALIEGSARGGLDGVLALAAVAGTAALAAFPFVERRQARPLVPLTIFRGRQFVGANLTTLAVYAAFGVALFLLVLELQDVLGYSPLEAGTSLLPITTLLLVLSSRVGRVSQRIGPRPFMTAGPLVVGVGLLLAAGIGPGDAYVSGVLPAVGVMGLGMALTVAPLTSAVMASVDEHHLGVASGFNNAVARVGSLLSIAVLPAVAGLGGVASTAPAFESGVQQALRVAAALAMTGGAVAFVLVRRSAAVRPVPVPDVGASCHDPCLRQPRSA